MTPVFKQDMKLFDAARIPYIIAEGESATEAILPTLRAMLETVEAA